MRWTCLLASILLAAPTIAQTAPDATLESPDGVFGAEFGIVVDVDGTTAAVGAPGAEEGDRDTGAVTLFERQPDGTWAQGQRLVPSDLTGGRFNERERFGVALDLDGDRLAVGAPGDDEGATRQVGAVYLFERQPDGTWIEVAKLREDVPLAFGGLGSAVSLDGDRLIATAERLSDPNTAYEGGTVTVFERQPDASWTPTATLTRPVSEGRVFFGEALALDGTRALIGATGSSNSATNRHGLAYLYELANGTWSEVADLDAPDGQTFNTGNFGEAVALRGDQALVADPNRSILYDGLGTFASGAAYLFARQPDGTWTVAERFLPDDLDRAELSSSRQIDFGTSAALDGGRVVIGAAEDVVAGQFEAGSVYVFENGSGVWEAAGKLGGGTAMSERLGSSVALDGEVAVTGAIFGSVSDTQTGIAYVHELGSALPTLSLVVQESIGVTDDPGVLAALQLLVQESIGVTDAPDLLTALLLLVREQIGVADAPSLTRGDGSASSGGAPVAIDTDLVRFLGPTGLAVEFDSVRVAGGVSVLFETVAPDEPLGIPGDATIAPYRWTVRASSELAFDSAGVVFDLSSLPLIRLDAGQDVVVYRRPSPGEGAFEALQTEIDAETGIVRGTGLTAFSEFALAGQDVIVDAEEAARPSIFGLSNPAPNPARNVSRVTLSLPVASPVRVDLLDIQGRRVATLVDGDLPAGETALEIRANALAAGVYVVFVRAGDQMAATRLTVVR